MGIRAPEDPSSSKTADVTDAQPLLLSVPSMQLKALSYVFLVRFISPEVLKKISASNTLLHELLQNLAHSGALHPLRNLVFI